MRPVRAFLAAALLAAPALPAAAQEADTTGPRFTTGALEVSVNGRVHVLFNTTDVDAAPASEVGLRRVRLEANVRVSDWISAKIQPEYAGSRVELRDAWVRLELDPMLALTAGRQHRPVGRISPWSSNRMLPVERGMRIRGVGGAELYNLLTELGYSDRDAGLLLTGEIPGTSLGLRYSAGYFNGPGRAEAPGRETGQWVARVEARPHRLFGAGASWSRRDFVDAQGTPEVVVTEAGNAFVVDAELGRDAPGPRAVAEVAWGDTDPVAGARFVAAQTWLAWRSGRVNRRIAHVEPLLRVSWGDPYRGARTTRVSEGGTLVTPGVNLWLGGMNRIGIDYDLWSADGDGEDARSLKVLFQVAF